MRESYSHEDKPYPGLGPCLNPGIGSPELQEWDSLRVAELQAADTMAADFTTCVDVIAELRPIARARYQHLPRVRREFAIAHALRNTLGQAAAQRTLGELLPLLSDELQTPEPIHPLLQPQSIQELRQNDTSYMGQLARYLPGDEGLLRNVLASMVKPQAELVFQSLSEREQIAFAETYGHLTRRLLQTASNLLESEHPELASNAEFLADPTGSYVVDPPIRIRRAATPYNPDNPAGQFTGAYEGGCELAAYVVGDAWRALASADYVNPPSPQHSFSSFC